MPNREKKARRKSQTLSAAAAAKIKKRKDMRFKKNRKKGFVWVT